MPELNLGVVTIGRNEGERLRRCLGSVLPFVSSTVYVDSGSTDGSSRLAIEMGAVVVNLDMSQPFTAARARNEGVRRLMTQQRDFDFVQFVDGDCEVVQGWLEHAATFLKDHPSYAVVSGRRRERHPERSVYNQLCDEEWDTPVGDALYCGGDAMIRMSALQAVGGYREGLIAGEEPELCVRLRQKGWRIHRLDREMTWHDADMTRLGQWWKRSVRSGHAFAEGAWLHGSPPELHWVKETRRIWAWGVLVPLLAAFAVFGLGPWGACLLLVYPAQWLRLFWRTGSARTSTFLLLGKFAEARGAIKFYVARWRGVSGPLIEYK